MYVVVCVCVVGQGPQPEGKVGKGSHAINTDLQLICTVKQAVLINVKRIRPPCTCFSESVAIFCLRSCKENFCFFMISWFLVMPKYLDKLLCRKESKYVIGTVFFLKIGTVIHY